MLTIGFTGLRGWKAVETSIRIPSLGNFIGTSSVSAAQYRPLCSLILTQKFTKASEFPTSSKTSKNWTSDQKLGVVGIAATTRSLTSSSISRLNRSPASSLKTSEKSLAPSGSPVSPEQAELIKNDPILKRIPKFLHRYTMRFMNAPFSHVLSFLVLHELTAIVPLLSLWYFFHQMPDMIPSFDLPTWAIDKGTKVIDHAMTKWDFTNYSLNDKFQFIMEGAYAYVVVKFLLPIRLMISLGLMPWFARWFVIPFTRLFSRKKKVPVPKEPLEQKTKKINKPRL